MPVSTSSGINVVYDASGRPKLVANQPIANRNVGNVRPHRGSPSYKCRAVQTAPRLDLVTAGSAVAVDCEGMYLPKKSGKASRGVGRISIVNANLDVIYDTFVYYPKHFDARPDPQRLKMGVTYNDVKPSNGAQPHAKVLAAVKKIFDKSGAIVGHSFDSDINMLRGIDFSPYTVHDTQDVAEYSYMPKLRELTAMVLGKQIQTSEHSSVEDAQATMELWMLHAKERGITTHKGLQHLAPGHLVALPNLPSLVNGREFDLKTSTYVKPAAAATEFFMDVSDI